MNFDTAKASVAHRYLWLVRLDVFVNLLEGNRIGEIEGAGEKGFTTSVGRMGAEVCFMPRISSMQSQEGVSEAISREGEIVLAIFFLEQHRYSYIYKTLGVMIPGCTVPHGGVAALRSSSSAMHGSTVGSRELAVFRNFMGLNPRRSLLILMRVDQRKQVAVNPQVRFSSDYAKWIKTVL